jgi:AraC family transcriptional regulator
MHSPDTLAAPALCITTMRSGSQSHRLDQRLVILDQDAYLILHGAAQRGSACHGAVAARPFVVCFPERMLAAQFGCGFRFMPSLRPHGDAVSLRLHWIAQQVEASGLDPRWYDEQRAWLLHVAIERELELRQRMECIASVKPTTRCELFRRVWWASDFILSNYERPITLDDIAVEARLSRFHLARLFGQVHGITPHAYLLKKRLAVARRLLAQTDCDLNEVAARAGFGTRSSLFRHLRQQLGCGAAAVRAAARPQRSLAANSRPSACRTCA